MGIVFTKEQEKVIYTKGKNLLVSAAAGSGKTAVLVERIIKMITDKNDPLDIDRLLVVTFTEAAALEMKERIGQAIDNAINAEPDNLFLQKQASLLYKAQISTIHSFCLNVIRNNFNDIGLDPNFRVADETELKLMQVDVLDSLFEELYETNDVDFINLVNYYDHKIDDDELKEYILKLSKFAEGNPWPLEWLDEQAKKYKFNDVNDIYNSTWVKYLNTYAEGKIDGAYRKIQLIKELLATDGAPDTYLNTILEDEQIIISLKNFDNIFGLRDQLSQIQFPNLARAPKDCDEDIKKNIQKLRGEYKDALISASKDNSLINFINHDVNEEILLINKIEPVILELIDVTKKFIIRFKEERVKKGIISFSDMEHYALEILYTTNELNEHYISDVAKEYQNAFDEILMDEYQDCNSVQESIMQSISGEHIGKYNRFMVGDVKQSIYKFRLANPKLFINKYECYGNADLSGQDKNTCERIDLHSNFRSRKTVINTVNDLFGQIMHSDFGQIEYDEDATLRCGASYISEDDIPTGDNAKEKLLSHRTNYDTQMLLIDLDNDSDLDKETQEAMLIASKIKEIVSYLMVTDKKTNELRRASYKDIVILLRSMGSNAISLKQVLTKEGIPNFMNLSCGFYDTKEIQTIIQLLKVIDNPRQDIPLYGCLKSYFGDMTDEEIANIRAFPVDEDNIHCLYDRLNLVKDEFIKVEKFLELLSMYRNMSFYTPIKDLILDIVHRTGYLEYISASAGGNQRKANVLMLISKAAAYENTSYKGLFYFNRYISELKKIESDDGEADIQDENSDVVRIMTIHKSKGLEFPVCILAGTHKKFNFKDATGNLAIDMDFGIGGSFIDVDKRIRRLPLYRKAVNLKLKQDVVGEELRVLYVALTRAREKLIITGAIKDKDSFMDEADQMYKLCEKTHRMPYESIASAKSYMDLMMGLMKDANIIELSELTKKDVDQSIKLIDEKEKFINDINNTLENHIYDELYKRMNRKYDKDIFINIPPKTSVSELKKAYIDETFSVSLFDHNEQTDDVPEFINKKDDALSGAERGSAYHKVMELLDFNDENVKSQLNNFINIGRISNRWAKAINIDKIEQMIKSPLGKRMAKAQALGVLYREQPFVLGINGDRVKSEYPKDEIMLLQGIIDAYFIEDNQIILVDYKTDVIKTGEDLLKRYKVQIEYYVEAIERILNLKVKESILYSFSLGKEIKY